MNILVIGGTRNLGHLLVQRLLDAGQSVTILNRGRSRDELPDRVERLRADRTNPQQLEQALAGRTFDAVVDNTVYHGHEAETIIRLLDDRVGHYIFLSSGQVYLVREGIERPFSEADYDGRLMPTPKPTTYSYEEWSYGMGKREAEDAFAAAWRERGFPYTSLRLPMVNGERDYFNRLYGYVLRLQDGGPIIVPSAPNFPLRHVYAGDVVTAIMTLILSGQGKGRAYNIAQDETVSLREFLTLLSESLGTNPPEIVPVTRGVLEAHGFLPDCSPFSEYWMSELDNTLSKIDLGLTYTPLATYLDYLANEFVRRDLPRPVSYRRRHSEKMLALQHAEA